VHAKESKEFFDRASALLTYLDHHLDDFHPSDTLASTLKIVHPSLNSIYFQANQLKVLDTALHKDGGKPSLSIP
jgi:uncharacterized protein YigA (DUF484 family)